MLKDIGLDALQQNFASADQRSVLSVLCHRNDRHVREIKPQQQFTRNVCHPAI